MFWAIITPELIIFWAMRQWYGAQKMKKEFESALSYCYICSKNHGDLRIMSYFSVGDQFNRGASPDHFKWTSTHGFFLQMGGFVLRENGGANSVLTWDTLMGHYRQGQVNLSVVTEARINDHSKADGFAKGLALLQTCWFIIQCVARFSDSRLTLTELELVTAALAILGLVMYFLWWNKPFNAEVPIILDISDYQSHVRVEGVNHEVQHNSQCE